MADRDIDTFAQSTFDNLGLNFDNVKARNAGVSNCTPVSVITAVAASREVCKLKYENGGARNPSLSLNLHDRMYLVILIMGFDIVSA